LLLCGEPDKTLKFSLGRWFGKERYITLILPGKRGLTAAQLNGWFAYEQIEPYGFFPQELRHGQEMALHLNLNRDSKTKPEPFTALECMNFIKPPPEKLLTPEEIEACFDKMFG
jgi:hypothetical protein